MKKLSWAQEQRITWIGEMLDVYGYINRSHIVKKFRVSVPQASHDLKLFNMMRPDTAVYNKNSKQYEATF